MLKEKTPLIQFIDLPAQYRLLEQKIAHSLTQVLSHGNFILGPEVTQLEQALIDYTGALDVITCANGTDALRLLLMSHQVGPNDAVFVPTFTFAASAEVIAQANATPIFVDICPTTFNLDVNSLQQAIEKIDRSRLTPKGIIAVDLFGLPANYEQIHQIAEQNNLWVIADSAQSFGGAIHGKKVGTLAQSTAVSFFPSKPLACYGDGGAILTTDKQISTLIRSLRNHGCGAHRYDYIYIGLNSRLDTLQAAILLEKLKIFPQEAKRRNEIAQFYSNALNELVETPKVTAGYTHAWGLYSILCAATQRDQLIDTLQQQQIPSNVYYRLPLHLQPAYKHFPRASDKLVHAEKICQQVLSLPMHPYLNDEQLAYIVQGVKKALLSK